MHVFLALSPFLALAFISLFIHGGNTAQLVGGAHAGREESSEVVKSTGGYQIEIFSRCSCLPEVATDLEDLEVLQVRHREKYDVLSSELIGP
ncbi:hypothetical protein K0M31_016383 [Melipona bicolor]|uniref:Uncharacterized protein n=1 Tax=Melipona bicolor TaxID=60889 RepID=A0AA40G719_9HYME|nr:hypothetical protein K0M31_016383 [Melipona bicolor]